MARNVEFSVYGRVNDQLNEAIRAVPAEQWQRAVGEDGEARHAGEVAELDVALDGWPPRPRAICRREKPHPGAQLRLWDTDGYRHQVTLTNSAGDAMGPRAAPDANHGVTVRVSPTPAPSWSLASTLTA